jgi:agmatinase
LGAPYECTVSGRPGARFAPGAIRAQSHDLETYSPYQDKELDDTAVFDAGDLELPFGDSEAALAMIEQRSRTVLEDGKRLLRSV